MNTIIIIFLVIIVIILIYFVLHNDKSKFVIPSPNTFSNSLPITTTALSTPEQVVLQPIEVLEPGYPLDEQYYYDPALFYDPYWWWGGGYGGGSSGYGGNHYRPHHRPSSGEIVHGGIQPGNIHISGGHMGGSRHH